MKRRSKRSGSASVGGRDGEGGNSVTVTRRMRPLGGQHKEEGGYFGGGTGVC